MTPSLFPHRRFLFILAAAMAPALIAMRAGAATSAPRIEQIQRREQFLPGPWSQGTFGDWKLATGRFEMIVAGENGQGAMGRILDIVLRDAPLDELEGFEPVALLGGEDPIRLALKAARTESPDEGQTVRLILTGAVADHPHVLVQTQYELKTDGSALCLTTSLTNATSETLYNAGLGDMADWSLYAPFMPYYGLADPSKIEVTYSPWVGAQIDNNTLGVALAKGMIEAKHAHGKSLLRYANASELKSGESLEAVRYLFIGGNDLSEFSDYALSLRNDPRGTVAGKILLPDGTPVEGVSVAVEAYDNDPPLQRPVGSASVAPLPYTLAISGKDGSYEFLAPVGKVRCQPRDVTRRTIAGATLMPYVEAGKTVAFQNMAVSGPAMLALRVVDADTGEPLPCKVTLQPIIDALPFNYGPPNQSRGMRNVWYVPNGEAGIPMPYKGSYEALITRGLEYTPAKLTITSQGGERMERLVPLKRAIDTTGYISMDLAVQTTASPRGSVSPDDMAVAAAGEGVEWLVSADVDRATDFRPAIQAEGLEKWIGATRGMTVEPNTRDIAGDFKVFPANAATSGAPFAPGYLETGAPGAILRRLRSDFPGSLLFVNRPLLMPNGYFRVIDFDLISGNVGHGPDDVIDFDLLGVFDGRQFRDRTMDQRLFSQSLENGWRYTPAAASSSRELFGNEPGYPRMYVAAPGDNPADVKEADLIESLRAGNVILTNGPFIRFEINGQGPGAMARAKDGVVRARLKILAIPEIYLTRYVISENGRFLQWLMFPTSEQIQRYPFGDRPEEFELKVKEDTAFHVMVWGERGPMPLISSVFGRTQNQFDTFAMTAPIYVDADGDGRFTPPVKK